MLQWCCVDDVVAFYCFSSRCRDDLHVQNLLLVFRLCVHVYVMYVCPVFCFHAFVCSCGLALLWEALFFSERLFGTFYTE
jgi:hypothetical protein